MTMDMKRGLSIGGLDKALRKYGKRQIRKIAKLKEELVGLENSKFAVQWATNICRRADKMVRHMASKFIFQPVPEIFKVQYARLASEISAIIAFCEKFLDEELCLNQKNVLAVVESPVGMIDGEWD